MNKNVPKKRKKLLSLRGLEAMHGYMFVLPFITGFVFLFLIPTMQSINYSFSLVSMDTEGISHSIIGGANYRFIFLEHPIWNETLVSTIIDNAAATVVILLFSLFAALLLNQKFFSRNIYRAIFFMPVIMTTGVAFSIIQSSLGAGDGTDLMGSLQTSFMFQATGMHDILLRGGIPPNIVAVIINTTNQIFNYIPKCGVQILLFLSGMAKIPVSHYEASKLEGAGAWLNFWRITFPILTPILFLNAIYTILDNFIAYGNQIMDIIHTTGFGRLQRLDHSAAMSWSYFTVVLLFFGIAWLLIGRPSNKLLES